MKLLIFVIMLIFILRLKKYNLSFKNNDTDLFNKCSIKLKN